MDEMIFETIWKKKGKKERKKSSSIKLIRGCSREEIYVKFICASFALR